MIKPNDLIIPLITSILGIAFPLIIQITQRIDEKYSSSRLVKRFYKEKIYIIFIYFLVYSLVFLFYNLVYPPNSNLALLQNNIILIDNISTIIATILAGLLIISMFKLIGLIKTYMDPNEFQDHIIDSIRKNKLQENDVRDWLELFIYCLKTDNTQLTRAGYTYLSDVINNFRVGRAYEVIEYPDYIYDTIISINETLCSQKKKVVSIHNGNEIIILLIDQHLNTLISEKTFKTIWISLYQQIHYNRSEWINEYWSYVHQYYGYNLNKDSLTYYKVKEDQNLNKNIATFDKIQKQFIEFHIALGGLLLYKKKYDILGNIMVYTNQEPPEYYLVPSSLVDIIEAYMDMHKLSFDALNKYEEKYSFLELNGVKKNDIIKSWIIKYLAILLIRLDSLQDYYGINSIYELPDIPNSIREKKIWVNKLTSLKNIVEYYIDEMTILNRINPTLLNENKEKNISISLTLDSFITSIEDSIKNQKKEQGLSMNKINTFKKEVSQTISNTLNAYIRTFRNLQIKTVNDFTINGNVKKILPSGCFEEDQDVSYSGFDSVLAHECIYKFTDSFAYLFLKNRKQHYYIKREETFKALDLLNIDPKKYIVLFFGIYMDYYLDVLKISLSKKDDIEYEYKGIQIVAFSYNRLLNDRVIIIEKSKIPNLIFNKPSDDEIKKYKLECILSDIELHYSVLKLAENQNIKIEISNDSNIQNLDQSVLACLTLNATLRIEKDTFLCVLNMVDQFANSGKDNLNEIKPII